ncbi:MAG: Holliday junction resolvase [Treponema sp.]|nr:Holliday junction resolvase [Treponema sp.]
MKYIFFNRLDLFFLCFFIITAVVFFLLGKLVQKVKDVNLIKRERNDAVKRSRAVIGGQFGEQVAPYLPEFPCNPGDARFIGKPVDFIAFKGCADKDEVEEILFVEVKSGSSTLSRRERQIKSAVEEGRVRFVEYRIS